MVYSLWFMVYGLLYVVVPRKISEDWLIMLKKLAEQAIFIPFFWPAQK